MHFSSSLISLIVLTIVCSSGAQICQKFAAQAADSNANRVFRLHFLTALVLLAAGLVAWLLVLAELDVGVAYPLLSLNYLIVMIAAKFVFRESIPTHRWLGTLIILAGILLLLSSNFA